MIDKKKLIKSKLTIHDRTQIEATFDYYLLRKASEPHKIHRKQRYQIDVFLFVPEQLDINARTYSLSHFYEDLRPILRLREPRNSFKSMMGLDVTTKSSPLLLFLEHVKNLQLDCQKRNLERALFAARIFACSFSSFLEKRSERIVKKVAHKNAEKSFKNIDLFLERAFQIFREFERGVEEALTSVQDDAGELRSILRAVHEYCFYRLANETAVIEIFCQQDELLNIEVKASSLSLFPYYRQALFERASKYNYFWLGCQPSDSEREEFINRFRLLKKRVWQALFLFPEERAILKLRRHIGYMSAAGVAAAWAFFANLLIWQKLHFAGFGQIHFLERMLGLSGLIFLGAFVLVYILKDRIKEIGRVKFYKGLLGRLPDNSRKIVHRDGLGYRRVLGTMQEAASFVRSYKGLPLEILKLKKEKLRNSIGGRNEILHYRKQVRLSGSQLARIGYSIKAVKDILRLNLHRFMLKLDDPTQEYAVLGNGTQSCLVKLPKIYSIDVILRYSQLNNFGKRENVSFECLRLVLNKDGLIRIDQK